MAFVPLAFAKHTNAATHTAGCMESWAGDTALPVQREHGARGNDLTKDVQIVPAAVSDPPRGGGPRGRRKHARSRGDRQWTGPKMRARLRELLKVEVVWGRRPLRWSPTKKRHYDQALARHHTDAEEQQLQGEHADRVQSKLLYRKALEVFRFLRTFGGKPVKFLQQVAKDTRWIEKVHTACWWGDQPPVGGGSEDYSEEIVELPTSEWLNTEEGEQSPYTPPSADRPQDDAGNLLGHSTQEGERDGKGPM